MYWSVEVQEKFIELWGGYSKKKVSFCLSQAPASIATLFSSRNLRLLTKGPQPKLAWDKFEAFTGRLLASRLLLPICLEEQCLVLLKNNKGNRRQLPDETLKRLGSCLESIIQSWKKSARRGSDLMNFTEDFLDWFAWIFTNMNIEEEFDDSDFPELRI